MIGDVDPLSQAQIEATLLDLMAAAQKVTVEVGRRARAHAEAETAYRVKFAQEFLRAGGSMDLRRYTAEAACAGELAARKETEALLLSAQEAGRNVRARLEAARSLCSNVRTAAAHATGMGG